LTLLLVFSGLFTNSGIRANTDPDEFKELRCEHFIVYYEEGVNREYAVEVKDIAEKFYRTITGEFNLIRDKLWLWENRAKIYIAKDKESFLKKFKCSEWSAACVDYQRKRIYTYPDDKRFKPVLIHELTHIIFREYVGSGNRALWLDEGMATYMEDKYDKEAYSRQLKFLKKKIKNNEYINLSRLNQITYKELNTFSQEEVALFYVESFSIIYFIIKENGRHNFWRFLYYLKSGKGTESALAAAFYRWKNLEELEKQWKRFYQE